MRHKISITHTKHTPKVNKSNCLGQGYKTSQQYTFYVLLLFIDV